MKYPKCKSTSNCKNGIVKGRQPKIIKNFSNTYDFGSPCTKAKFLLQHLKQIYEEIQNTRKDI